MKKYISLISLFAASSLLWFIGAASIIVTFPANFEAEKEFGGYFFGSIMTLISFVLFFELAKKLNIDTSPIKRRLF